MRTRNKVWILGILGIVMLLLGVVTYYYTLPPKQFHIRVIGKNADSCIEFWDVLANGIETAAKEFDITYDYVSCKEEKDVEEQILLIEETIEKKPDGLILIATDYERTAPAVQRVIDAHIPVVCLDSDSNVKDRIFVSTDNIEAGKKAGYELFQRMDPEKKVLIVTQNDFSSTAVDRQNGIRQGFESDDRISYCIYSNSDADTAYEETYRLLKEHTDIGGIVGTNEPSTVGAARAVKFLGLQDQIKIVGFDSSIHEVKMMEEGLIQATVVQKPYNMGYLAVKVMHDKLRGKKSKQIIYTETALVTKDNISEQENQKAIFMFAQ